MLSLKATCSNFELITFINDADKIRFFKSDHSLPDPIFPDPDPCGIDFLKFIRSRYLSNNFHAIMYGSDAPERHSDVCYCLGATAYKRKTNDQKLTMKMLDFCINGLKDSAIEEYFVLNKKFDCGGKK